MKSSGASAVAAAAALIGGGFTFSAIKNPAGSSLAAWAWQAGGWLVEKSSLPSAIPSAPALAVAVVVAVFCAAAAFLIFWRLELWAAGKSSENAQQVLRSPRGASVEAEMKKLTRKHGR
jgi:hypothetical protein